MDRTQRSIDPQCRFVLANLLALFTGLLCLFGGVACGGRAPGAYEDCGRVAFDQDRRETVGDLLISREGRTVAISAPRDLRIRFGSGQPGPSASPEHNETTHEVLTVVLGSRFENALVHLRTLDSGPTLFLPGPYDLVSRLEREWAELPQNQKHRLFVLLGTDRIRIQGQSFEVRAGSHRGRYGAGLGRCGFSDFPDTASYLGWQAPPVAVTKAVFAFPGQTQANWTFAPSFLGQGGPSEHLDGRRLVGGVSLTFPAP